MTWRQVIQDSASETARHASQVDEKIGEQKSTLRLQDHAVASKPNATIQPDRPSGRRVETHGFNDCTVALVARLARRVQRCQFSWAVTGPIFKRALTLNIAHLDVNVTSRITIAEVETTSLRIGGLGVAVDHRSAWYVRLTYTPSLYFHAAVRHKGLRTQGLLRLPSGRPTPYFHAAVRRKGLRTQGLLPPPYEQITQELQLTDDYKPLLTMSTYHMLRPDTTNKS